MSVRVLTTATLMLFVCGCALFRSGESGNGLGITWRELRGTENAAAEADEGAPRLNVAQLEANIVHRPANDARIRTLVWEELDESGVMSPDQRQQLNASGFRIGVASGSTPWALQSLAQDARKVPVSSGASDMPDATTQIPLGPSFPVFEGGSTRLEVQQELDSSLIPLQSIEGLDGMRQTDNLRCTVQVTVKEASEDWVLLTVLPQIHSGTRALRLSVVGNSDQLPVRQSVYPLYEQQFQVKLHRGEVAVIGRFGSEEWNAGRLFFQPTRGSSASESLLMIRLLGVDQVTGRSETSVSVGKKYHW
ncbi:MAG: hypothetical protein KDA91_20285 [Planctomycetaceae bacterium]|nr:hypothetical protein [Planctomycetaceae bacterium]